MDNYKLDTLCVQAGYSPKSGEARIPPIVQSTTYFYPKTQDMADLFDLKSDGYFYSRLANPTVAAFEGKVAALEGGVCAIGCASGMSAISLAVFTVAGSGDNVVASSAIYGGTYNLFSTTLPKLGIECRFFDPDAPADDIDKLIDGKTKMIFTETVANPAIVVLDFEKIAKIAQKHSVLFAVDNTLATPIFCRPKEWGANPCYSLLFQIPRRARGGAGRGYRRFGEFRFQGQQTLPRIQRARRKLSRACLCRFTRCVRHKVPRADDARLRRDYESAERIYIVHRLRYAGAENGAALRKREKDCFIP